MKMAVVACYGSIEGLGFAAASSSPLGVCVVLVQGSRQKKRIRAARLGDDLRRTRELGTERSLGATTRGAGPRAAILRGVQLWLRQRL
jgi:hypothetical protein